MPQLRNTKASLSNAFGSAANAISSAVRNAAVKNASSSSKKMGDLFSDLEQGVRETPNIAGYNPYYNGPSAPAYMPIYNRRQDDSSEVPAEDKGNSFGDISREISQRVKKNKTQENLDNLAKASNKAAPGLEGNTPLSGLNYLFGPEIAFADEGGSPQSTENSIASDTPNQAAPVASGNKSAPEPQPHVASPNEIDEYVKADPGYLFNPMMDFLNKIYSGGFRAPAGGADWFDNLSYSPAQLTREAQAMIGQNADVGGNYELSNRVTQEDSFYKWLDTPEGEAFLARHPEYGKNGYTTFRFETDPEILREIMGADEWEGQGVGGWLGGVYDFDSFDDYYSWWMNNPVNWKPWVNLDGDIDYSGLGGYSDTGDFYAYALANGLLDVSGYGDYTPEEWGVAAALSRALHNPESLTEWDISEINEMTEKAGLPWRIGVMGDGSPYMTEQELFDSDSIYRNSRYAEQRSDFDELVNQFNAGSDSRKLGFKGTR